MQEENSAPFLRESKCSNCGARIVFDPVNQVVRCAFCGSEFLAELPEEEASISVKLEGNQIAPVSVDAALAQAKFKKWLASGFWQPWELTREFKATRASMLYIPCWFISTNVVTTWQGEFSQTHYRPVTKTRIVYDRNGRSVNEQYVEDEPYAVWWPKNGQRSWDYSDTIPASSLLTQVEMDQLKFYPKDFKPLLQEYMLGWQGVKPTVDEQTANYISQERINAREGSDCRSQVERLHNWQCHFTPQGRYMVYLPIWIFGYAYRGKSYRVIIHGRSGEVFGGKPLCRLKIALASMIALLILGIAVFLVDEKSSSKSNTFATSTPFPNLDFKQKENLASADYSAPHAPSNGLPFFIPQQTNTARQTSRIMENKTTAHEIIGRWIATPKPKTEEPKPTPMSEQQVTAPESKVQTYGRPEFITVSEAQRVAVAIYPDLGIAGSKLNIKFLNRYKEYQVTRPDYFRDPSWPLRLAEEISLPSKGK
jgi:DNA-directed RNA polymerase subunit RPC12/RpoP